jgi:hypothetical protein
VLPCLTKVNAVFDSPDDGKLFILINSDDLWKYDRVRDEWKRSVLSNVYSKLDAGAEGGAQCSNGLTWFIKGDQLWAFKKTLLQSKFPIKIEPAYWSEQSTSPSVLVNKNNKIYILKDAIAYEFDTTTLKIVNRHHLVSIFPNLPTTVHASYKLNGLIYFFDNEK